MRVAVRVVALEFGLISLGVGVVVLWSYWQTWRRTRERQWGARVGLVVSYLLLASLAINGILKRLLADAPLTIQSGVFMITFLIATVSFLNVLEDQRHVFGEPS